MLRNFSCAAALALSLVCIALAGCKTTESDSAAKIIQGVTDDTGHPATVAILALNANNKFLSYCTGTFIRDDLLITAGHCTVFAGTSSFQVFSKVAPLDKSRPISHMYTVHPDFSMSDPSPRQRDAAFIIFPKNTAPSHMIAKLADNQGQLGDQVTMVGYGGSNDDPLVWELSGIRRSGDNKIKDIVYDQAGPYDMYKINATFAQGSATGASIYYGDSGGPLFNQMGELIGIAQSGKATMFGRDMRFVDLLSYGLKTYINDQLAGNIKPIDISAVPPAKPNAAAIPICSANNGRGFGPLSECDGGECAKLEADLVKTCFVRASLQGRNLCLNNGGRGYGTVFDCVGQRCAFDESNLTNECVLGAIVHED